MEIDDTDDSRFTVEKMDFMIEDKLPLDRRKLVSGVMDAICGSLDERLNALKELIAKNKRDVRKCTTRIDRYREIVETYDDANQSDDLTSIIKYYFALAKSDKHSKAQEGLSIDKPSTSPIEYERTFHTTRSKNERKQLDDDIQWLTTYGTVTLFKKEYAA